MTSKVENYINTYSSSATLAFFRLAFGLMMLTSLIRFASYGWIEKFYINPKFHFTYYGFEWIQPLGNFTYLLFLICGISALFVAIGYHYKMAIVMFFMTFTYIELMDKTNYLNHYYFITVISFIMIFLPANCYFSVDGCKNPKIIFQKIPSWNIDILKLLLAIVYIFAGLAKLNSDWLLGAMPLKIWLPANDTLPVIGSLLNKNWVQYAFSWTGMIYDLFIVFLLLYKRTRIFAFFLVVVFHILTRILFPIGVFPYIMIVSTLIFFDAHLHKKSIEIVARLFKISILLFENGKEKTQKFNMLYKLKLVFISCFIAFQLLFPFRYLVYPDELFWTEEGYRFSWRVMLMEKAGYTEFTITDSKTKQTIRVTNSDFLTSFQEKQMSFQPDFILEYAHYLHKHYKTKGVNNPIVHAQSYVALNGRLSQKFINPNINLANENETFHHKTWILPLNDTIKGL